MELTVSLFSGQPPLGFEPVSLVDVKACPVAEDLKRKHKSLWLIRVPHDVSILTLHLRQLLLGTNWCINCEMRVMDAVKETIADVLSIFV